MISKEITQGLISYIKQLDVSFEQAKDKAETLYLVFFEAENKEDLLLDIKYFIMEYGHYPKEWETPFFMSHKYKKQVEIL